MYLPRLLHVCFLNFDSPNDLIYEQSRLLVMNLVHSLVAKHSGVSEDHDRATRFIAIIGSNEGTAAKRTRGGR